MPWLPKMKVGFKLPSILKKKKNKRRKGARPTSAWRDLLDRARGRKIDDPVTNYLNDVFTVPANLAGLPGISVPGGLTSDGLPLGLQVVGRPFDEASIYRVAAVLEDAAGFTQTPAPLAFGGVA